MKNIFKSILALHILLLSSAWLIASAPQGLNYQAIVRDNAGAPVANGTNVLLRFTIHDTTPTGNSEFTETDTAIANQFGLVTTVIGANGTLANVSWSSGNKFLQVEAQLNNSGNFADMGTTQMQSVPYALYAQSTGSPDTPVFINAYAILSVSTDSLDHDFTNYHAYTNEGGGLNTTTGVFIAPVDGNYMVSIYRNFNYTLFSRLYISCSAAGGAETLPDHQTSYTRCIKMRSGDFIDLSAEPVNTVTFDEYVSLSIYKMK